MKNYKKITALLLCGCMAASMTACGSGSGGSSAKASDDTSYTMWIYSGADASYYTEYSENPALQYALSKTWGKDNKTLAFDFWVPAAGTAADNYSTMIGSGDLPDVMDASISDPPAQMYEAGYVMDLTDLIQENMPNYMAFVEEHPELHSIFYDTVDGEDRMLRVVSGYDDYDYYFSGMEYRRDWIVKYGKNPETGEAFTGGYTDPEDADSWEDDVVFPSGGSDPVYISDWEWMFEIFQTAMEAEGIEDGYCTSMYYPGFTWSGGLCSSFGGSVVMWYKAEDGSVQFGADQDSYRAYLECLNTWYANGWLDQSFNERTSDAHYSIDDTTVRQGKVGMWCGMQSQLGGRMDAGDGGYTDGICVYGCAWPINDVYGTEETQNVEPRCVSGTGLTGTAFYVTTKAEGKDIASLLSFFDYFYSEEGALLHTLGLSAEQQKEMDSQVYKDNGLEDGAYTVSDDGTYVMSDTLVNDGGGLATAAAVTKLPGMTLIKNVDRGYADTYKNSLESWIKYKNTGFYQGSAVTNNMTQEETTEITKIQTKVLEFLTTRSVQMIKGETDPYSDSDWSDWCKMLAKYNYQRVIEIAQPYVDKYTF